MKLREFVPTKIERSPHHVKAYILINLRYSLIQFSGGAVDLIGVKPDSHVSFHQDEDDPESWYLEVLPEGKTGFPLRQKPKLGVRGVLFACKSLVKRIADAVGMEGHKGKILVGKESVTINGKTLWPLVTASLKPKRLD
ncbi:hypothetical protein [Chitinophaga sp. CF418]|uniref:hypothetical protein n=1 Tax=Chitinophaga sp. CF418 TaxID=1855287 RepID=UPI0009224532|nr:hypothetical protein [Chitinophaga sp. CF418]SHN45877.1 hypothetical protein SAMN05216311_12210 [Chitinophaga sp. CF418]